MRASIAAETAGIPSVSIVCEGFVGQAAATGRGLGFDGLPLAVLAGHVDARSHDEMVADFVATTVDQVVAGLTTLTEPGGHDAGPEQGGPEPTALDIVVSGSIDHVHREFASRGWSDGSPIIPPTPDRVASFLEATGHDPWRTVGISPSSGRDMTIWSVATNAVMAGCDPAHLPILIAAAETLADPHYGSQHSGNTTGADALMILSGPSAASLGFNSGPGALRDGTPANTSVGRWLRLYQRNVCGFTSDEHDKATFGNSFRVVLTEDLATLDDIGWVPLCTDFGIDGHDDALTMARMNSGAIIGSVFGSTPEEIAPYLGDGIARVAGWDLTHVFGLGTNQFRPLLVLSPILARTFARAGMSRDDARRALWQHAKIPAWRFEKLIGEWSNLTTGRRTLNQLAAEGHIPEIYARGEDPERLVPVVPEPSRIALAVAGDPNRTNAYVFSNDGPHGDWTARRIDHTPSSDLACQVPAP